MNESKACKIARAFLSDQIELEQCNELPGGLYKFNDAEEILYRFRLFSHLSFGGSEYIAVSKESGAVRYLGFLGE